MEWENESISWWFKVKDKVRVGIKLGIGLYGIDIESHSIRDRYSIWDTYIRKLLIH